MQSIVDTDPRAVYISNVAYEAQAPTVLEILKEVGPVQSFALKNDTGIPGKHSGSGYALYLDEATAERAIRTLNGRSLYGRHMVVDSMRDRTLGGRSRRERERERFVPPGQFAAPGMQQQQQQPAQQFMQAAPMGVAQPWQQQQQVQGGASYQMSAPSMTQAPGVYGAAGQQLGVTVHQQQVQTQPQQHLGAMPMQAAGSATGLPSGIAAVVDSMPEQELAYVVREMRSLANSDPEQAKALLTQYPTLARALLVIQDRLGLLKAGMAQAPAAMYAPPAASAAVSGSYQAVAAAPYTGLQQQQPQYQQQPMQLEPAQQFAAAAPRPQQQLSEEDQQQLEIIRGILDMKPADVQALEPEQRESAMAVRDAVLLPLAAIQALPQPRQTELLQLREQLQTLVRVTP